MLRAGRLRAMRRACMSLVWTVAALANPAWVAAKPFVPQSDAEVVETLPSSSAERGLKLMRAALAREPGNLELALKVARRYIDTSRGDGDPRYLGYAQSALARWWTGENPEVVLLRATIRQSRHEFEPALDDLRRLTYSNPDNVQAWLTRATVEQVRGQFHEARESCGRLADLLRNVIGFACVAEVDSLAGDGSAYDKLTRRIESDASLDPGTRAWLYTVLAEMAERRGAAADAEKHFKAAWALAPSLYLRTALADFLLAGGRPQVVIARIPLKGDVAQLPDALLLRRVLALQMIVKQSGQPAQQAGRAEEHKAELQLLADATRARFAASAERGENLHAREEARFVLAIDGDAGRALELAQLNWRSQKEPADARILALAARAANRPDALVPLRTFVAETRFTDAALAAML